MSDQNQDPFQHESTPELDLAPYAEPYQDIELADFIEPVPGITETIEIGGWTFIRTNYQGIAAIYE